MIKIAAVPVTARLSRWPPLNARRLSCSRSRASKNANPIVLFDIMDTVVYDPFYEQVPKFFNLTFAELMEVKSPTHWPLFERGEISESHLLENFFTDGRSFNHADFIEMMMDQYVFLDGMEDVLQRLKSSRAEMHAFSNYPEWYRLIEEKLKLSQYLDWTFVSCKAPMKGLRKPDVRAFEVVMESLRCDPSEILLIDDREANVKAAEDLGFDTVHFTDASSLITALQEHGWDV